MNNSDWIAYHGTVRATIHGLDQLITTLLIQSVGIIGVALSLSQFGSVGSVGDAGLKFWIAWGLLIIPIAVNFYIILYSHFLTSAIGIAKKVELKAGLESDLRLTKSFEHSLLAGARLGPILNVLTGAALGFLTLGVASFRLHEWAPDTTTLVWASIALSILGLVLVILPILNVVSYLLQFELIARWKARRSSRG